MGTLIASLVGKGAFKAIAGGLASAGTATTAMAIGACDLEGIGQQAGRRRVLLSLGILSLGWVRRIVDAKPLRG